MSQKKLYLKYWQIGKEEYWQKVNFFEEKQNDISLLDFEEKYEIELDYLNAVFEIGKYDKYLKLVDIYITEALELDHNLFVQLLVKKAAAYYNLDSISEAKFISKQALSLDPENSLGQSILLQCIRKNKSPNHKAIRAISNFLLLFSAGSIVVDWLLIAPFYPQYNDLVANGIRSLVTMTIAILVLNELIYYFRGRKEWRDQLETLKQKYLRKKRKKGQGEN